jgi:hypothetical protein
MHYILNMIRNNGKVTTVKNDTITDTCGTSYIYEHGRKTSSKQTVNEQNNARHILQNTTKRGSKVGNIALNGVTK